MLCSALNGLFSLVHLKASRTCKSSTTFFNECKKALTYCSHSCVCDVCMGGAIYFIWHIPYSIYTYIYLYSYISGAPVIKYADNARPARAS